MFTFKDHTVNNLYGEIRNNFLLVALCFSKPAFTLEGLFSAVHFLNHDCEVFYGVFRKVAALSFWIYFQSCGHEGECIRCSWSHSPTAYRTSWTRSDTISFSRAGGSCVYVWQVTVLWILLVAHSVQQVLQHLILPAWPFCLLSSEMGLSSALTSKFLRFVGGVDGYLKSTHNLTFPSLLWAGTVGIAYLVLNSHSVNFYM